MREIDRTTQFRRDYRRESRGRRRGTLDASLATVIVPRMGKSGTVIYFKPTNPSAARRLRGQGPSPHRDDPPQGPFGGGALAHGEPQGVARTRIYTMSQSSQDERALQEVG